MTPTPHLTPFAIINLLGAAQGILLAIAVFFTPHGKRTANRLLAALVATWALIIGEIFLCETNYVLAVPHVVDTTEPLVFLIGPLLYLYTRSLLARAAPESWRSALHIIPAVLHALYLVPFYLQATPAKIEAFYAAYHPELVSLLDAPSAPALHRLLPLRGMHDELAMLHLWTYVGVAVWWGMRTLRRRRAAGDVVRRRTLVKLGALLVIMLLPLVLHAGTSLYGITDAADPLIAALLSLAIYAVGYVQLFHPGGLARGPVEAPAPEPEKYATSSLSETEKAAFQRRILEALEREELYLDASLTLPQLAEACGLSRHHVSQVINECFGQHFADFINERRVEVAKALLADPETAVLTLEEIGYRSGFNARSSFYRAFKKFTGQSPAQYRDWAEAS